MSGDHMSGDHTHPKHTHHDDPGPIGTEPQIREPGRPSIPREWVHELGDLRPFPPAPPPEPELIDAFVIHMAGCHGYTRGAVVSMGGAAAVSAHVAAHARMSRERDHRNVGVPLGAARMSNSDTFYRIVVGLCCTATIVALIVYMLVHR